MNTQSNTHMPANTVKYIRTLTIKGTYEYTQSITQIRTHSQIHTNTLSSTHIRTHRKNTRTTKISIRFVAYKYIFFKKLYFLFNQYITLFITEIEIKTSSPSRGLVFILKLTFPMFDPSRQSE